MYEPPSSDAQELYLNETKTLIENIKLVARPDDREAAYWLQLLKSMDAQAEFYWKTAGKSDDYLNSHPEISDLRDIQMGQNLIWLANEYYTDKKIIVWAATYPNGSEVSVPIEYMYGRELSIHSVFLSPYSFPRAIQMLPKLDLKPLITVYPLKEVVQALEAHKKGKGVKIMLQP